jgi:hypothetical protein
MRRKERIKWRRILRKGNIKKEKHNKSRRRNM